MRPEDFGKIEYVWQLQGIRAYIVNSGGEYSANGNLYSAFSDEEVRLVGIREEFNLVDYSISSREGGWNDEDEASVSMYLDELEKIDFESVMRESFLFKHSNKVLFLDYQNALHSAIEKYKTTTFSNRIRKYLSHPRPLNPTIASFEEAILLLKCAEKLFLQDPPEKISQDVVLKQHAVGFQAKKRIRIAEEFLSGLPGIKIPKCPPEIAQWLSWK